METRSNRLFIDPDTRQYYSDIKMKYGDLKLSNSDLFSLALAMGCLYNIKKPLDRKVGFIRYETIPEDLLALIDLLAIDEFGGDNQELLDNHLLGFDLAEEYANAGIKILIEKIYDYDFDPFLFKSILDLYDGIDFEKLESSFQE